MSNVSIYGSIRGQIREKLDEHIKQILQKPEISAEEHTLLELVDSRYAALEEALSEHACDKKMDAAWLLPLALLLGMNSFGGDK